MMYVIGSGFMVYMAYEMRMNSHDSLVHLHLHSNNPSTDISNTCEIYIRKGFYRHCFWVYLSWLKYGFILVESRIDLLRWLNLHINEDSDSNQFN